jgi:hypothetical protein
MKIFLTLTSITLCIGLFGCAERHKSDCKVRNISNSEIRDITIVICKQRFTANNIKHGEERMFNYVVKGDSGYQIKVSFSDGHSLEKEDGYVTHGVVFHDLIVVDVNAITLVQKSENGY